VKKFEQRQCVPDLVFSGDVLRNASASLTAAPGFSPGLPGPGFRQKCMPGLDCLAHFLGWMLFRDRHELNFIYWATSFCSRLRDSLANALKIFGNRDHAEL